MKYLAALLSIAGVMSTAAVAEPVILKGDAIAETLVGAKYVSPSRGGLATIVFAEDGSMSGSTERGHSDTGEWSVENDLFCWQWTRWQKAEKNCWALRLDDEKLYFLDKDGDVDDDGKLIR